MSDIEQNSDLESQQEQCHFDGMWTFTTITEEFLEIMKLMGYNKLQRKWLKTRKILINSKLEGDIYQVFSEVKRALKNNIFDVEIIDENSMAFIIPISYDKVFRGKTLRLNPAPHCKWFDDDL